VPLLHARRVLGSSSSSANVEASPRMTDATNSIPIVETVDEDDDDDGWS
jgi:hypothetical protein